VDSGECLPAADPPSERFTTRKPPGGHARTGVGTVKRVVYSSYLGGQWNHLWVMTADGGDPFQLTYGEGDATAPRWSPDGSRIAYVSNVEGDLRIQIVTVPRGIDRAAPLTGAQISPTDRPISLTVVDAAGRAIPARVSITGGDGRSYGPESAWMHADDSFDRGERPLEYGYFHSSGGSRITVPTGRSRRRGVPRSGVSGGAAVAAGEAWSCDPGSHRAQAPGDPAGGWLVQRRPSHPHELRRQLPQHAPTPGGAGPGQRTSTWWRTSS
jgi:hypothetical protein